MKLRSTIVGAALLLGAAPVVVGSSTIACAAEGDSAVLVVDTGDSELRYCVALPSSSVSGIELIRLAGQQHGLQYSLGYGGQAVCQLNGVGPEGDDCFADDPYFWGYWHGNSSGGWAWSSWGAASYRVESGDVEGWSWGTGQSGETHQQPPQTTYYSVCPKPAGSNEGESQSADAERDRPSKPGDTSNPGSAAAAHSEPEAEVVSTPSEKQRKRSGNDGHRPKKSEADEEAATVGLVTRPATQNKITDPVSAAPEVEPADGPSAAALVALVAAMAFVVAGGAIARRRKT